MFIYIIHYDLSRRLNKDLINQFNLLFGGPFIYVFVMYLH